MGSGTSQLEADIQELRNQRLASEREQEKVRENLRRERAENEKLRLQLREHVQEAKSSKEQLDRAIKSFKEAMENYQKTIAALEKRNDELQAEIKALGAQVTGLLSRIGKQQKEFELSLEQRDKLNQERLLEKDKQFRSEQLARDALYQKISAERDAAFNAKVDMLVTVIAKQNVATRTKRSTWKQARHQLAMVNAFSRQFHEGRLREIQNERLNRGSLKLAAMCAEADAKYETEIKMLKKYVLAQATPSGRDLQRMVEGVQQNLVRKYDSQGLLGSGFKAENVHLLPAQAQPNNYEMLG